MVERARGRASVARYRAHSSAGPYLVGEISQGRNAASQLGLAETNRIDGYLARNDLAGVVARHGLVGDGRGTVPLRATSMDIDVVRDLSTRGLVLTALDLAESLDVRERRARLNGLEAALEEFGD